MENSRAKKKVRRMLLRNGKWYVLPDKYGRFSIPKLYSSRKEQISGYRVYQFDNDTIILEIDDKMPILKQVCIPFMVREAMKVDGKTWFEIKRRSEGSFTLTPCNEELKR